MFRLLLAGLAAAGITTGHASLAKAASSCPELNVLTWEGYADDAWVKPFEQAHDVKVNRVYITSGDEEIAKIRAGGGQLYDVVSISSDNYKTLTGTGALVVLDASKLENTKGYLSFLQKKFETGSKIMGVPFLWDVNPFVYNVAAFKKLGLPVPPASFDVLWDPRLKGKVAVWNEISTLYIAATVLGIDKDPQTAFNMSDDQLEKVRDKLVALKPNILKLWDSDGEATDLFASGQAIAGLAWTDIYTQAKGRGADVAAIVFPNQGAQGWVDGFALTKGRPQCQDLAYTYLNYVTSPKVLVQISGTTGYPPANTDVKPLLDQSTIQKYRLDDPETLAQHVIFKSDPARRDRYIETLNEFKTAPTP
jgi:putative spermidine/putrescine transport system substrate-binding protein/spermidine/putrescine transport system substrate-binding protein